MLKYICKHRLFNIYHQNNCNISPEKFAWHSPLMKCRFTWLSHLMQGIIQNILLVSFSSLFFHRLEVLEVMNCDEISPSFCFFVLFCDFPEDSFVLFKLWNRIFQNFWNGKQVNYMFFFTAVIMNSLLSDMKCKYIIVISNQIGKFESKLLSMSFPSISRIFVLR